MADGARPRSMVRRLLVGAFLVLVGFVYGFLTYRQEILPYSAMASLRGLLAGARPAPPPRNDSPDQGRWRPARAFPPGHVLDQDELDSLGNLRTLGCLAGQDLAPSTSGVTRIDPEAVQPGLNRYTSGHEATAYLMDMEGEILHRWHMPYEQAFPAGKRVVRSEGWRQAHLFDNGDLLAIDEGLGLVMLHRDSTILWQDDRHAHHDIHVDAQGTIYNLSWEMTMVPGEIARTPVLADFVDIRTPGGRLQEKLSILDAIENSRYASILYHLPARMLRDGLGKEVSGAGPAGEPGPEYHDPLHTNTIEVLDGRFAAAAPFLAKGNLLLFDNLGARGWSKVIEFDPLTQEVEWAYRGSPSRPFYTQMRGSAQRLENGNTLITESDRGRAFEVSRDGRVVWEFVSPHRAGDQNELIATLYEVVRLPPDAGEAWLED